jgi:UDPglucose 6-dehydrogenase
MKICSIGTGYVGLVTGSCLADFGIEVVGVDVDEDKIAALQELRIPIYEPGLRNLVSRNVREGRLSFSTDLGSAIESSRAIFIAVGTPPKADGSADLKFILQVAESIGKHLNGYKIIVTKSTVPIGTGQLIREIVDEISGGDREFAVVSNPEFLREGSAIADFMGPDRVVIGTDDQRALDTLMDIYSPLHVAGVPFVTTNVESAELIKYASNSFLATKISFINEVAELCEHVGADVEVVAQGMGLDARIGGRFLRAGPGFGGSCFPKDTSALASIARDNGLRFRIVEAVLEVNDRTRARMLAKVEEAFGGVKGKCIAALGVAFKPDTDDLRDSPAVAVIDGLLERGAQVRACDPAAGDVARLRLPDVTFCEDPYQAADGADGLVIMTEWNQFRKLSMRRLRQLLEEPLIVDLRNVYDPESMANAGFRYVSVGRRTIEATS